MPNNPDFIKITYIISDVDKALAFEWAAKYLNPHYTLHFVLIGKENTVLAKFLKENAIPFSEVVYQKYPTFLSQWFRVFTILRKEKPDIVHTHLWRANQLGLSAAWLLRIKKRVFTRHHATIHYNEFPSGRKWDVLINSLATHIIAISKSIQEILVNWDKAKPEKVHLIHHGFDVDYFQFVDKERINVLKQKYHLSDTTFPIIGVISRYMKWKGIQHIIPAYKAILASYPNARLLLANAQGDYMPEIKALLTQLPPNSFIEIKFEKDLAALYQLFDVFIHVPEDEHVEAFGQVYVEALLAGAPSIFTYSGIAPEFVVHKKNAWVVDYNRSDEIAAAIIALLSQAELRKTVIIQGLQSAKQFSIQNHILALQNLYNLPT